MPATADQIAFLEGMIDGMRCGILAVDSAGTLRWINDVARKILDLPSGPYVGQSAEVVLAPFPHLRSVLRESVTMTSLPNRAEIEIGPRPTGGKTLGFTLSRILDGAGEVRGTAMFFKDLTQIEHREEQVRLKDRLANLGEMAARLAHEIRNPLASIEVSCTLLKRRLGTGQAGPELVDRIVDEVRRVNTSVRASLEFVRPVRPRLAAIELVPLLDEAITVARERHRPSAIAVDRRLDADVPPFLVDRELMRNVFVNLIVNAMEASGERGTVTVSAEVLESSSESSVPYVPAGGSARESWTSADRFVVVRVADTGPGVPIEARERIFYPFFTTKKSGSGVGLAIARKIVGSHHGLIDVDTAAGGGAEFSVRLPILVEEPPA